MSDQVSPGRFFHVRGLKKEADVIGKLWCGPIMGLLISACSSSGDTPHIPEAQPLSAQSDLTRLSDSDQTSRRKETGMEKQSKIYWAKRLNLPVYDQNGVVIRSLRLQSRVLVYETASQFGRIDREKDEWVDLSEFTDIEPETPLLQERLWSGPEPVTLPKRPTETSNPDG